MNGLVSVVMPSYNEAENLDPVITTLVDELRRVGYDFEVVIVDDGSSDASAKVVAQLAACNPSIRLIRLRRNFGKSAALAEGLRRTKGSVVVLMDADGQDDAASIPELIAELDEGFDLVTGRRQLRQDRFVKRSTSRLYNSLTRRVTGVAGRDFNSGLKVMRREIAENLDLYGEMHRYIPVIAHWQGFRVTERDVPHHSRMGGQSKFGRSRFWRGFVDLLTVKFLISYQSRPLHLFGAIGGVAGLLGLLMLAYLTFDKLVNGEAIGDRPLLILGVLLVIIGIQVVSLGLIAELLVHQHVARHREEESRRVIDLGPPRD